MNEETIFYLVWNPAGGLPTARHESDVEAIQEARRLARKQPGQRFYVLEARARYEAEEIPVSETFLYRR